jgi:four helix bundle protein
MKPRAVRSHKDLILWQKAFDLAVEVHKATSSFPRFELFGLVAQLRRASVSVPSNIAEGSARTSTREFLHFLRIARGSLAEMQTQLHLAKAIGYLPEPTLSEIDPKVEEVGRILNAVLVGLLRRLQSRSDCSLFTDH